MKRIVLIVVGIVMGCMVFANDIQSVTITYEYTSGDENLTASQVEFNATEQAKLKALEDNFGSDVSSITTIVQRSEGVSSSQNILSLRQTAVRGEWVTTTDEKVLVAPTFKDGFWYTKVQLKGKVRSRTTIRADIKYALLNDVKDKVSRTTFTDGDDLFLTFSAPIKGVLAVYLIDPAEATYCLLPYPDNTMGYESIEPNKDYLFFSNSTDPKAVEYTLTCQRSMEQNIVCIIFSTRPFSKAHDTGGTTNWRNEPLPRQLPTEDFWKWLTTNRTRDEYMDVRMELITINKNR